MKRITLLFILLLIFVFYGSNAQVKNILLEEMSTTLCSFCPYKSADLMKYAKENPRAIAIIHHAGFGQDAMTNDAAKDFASAFNPSHFPSMTIDRKKFDSVGTYYTDKVGISMMAFPWEDTVTAHLSYVTPKVVVDIDHAYNTNTRTITGIIEVNFLVVPESADYRINLYIIEDSVVGDTGAFAYDQKNNKTNDPSYPELYGKTLIQYYIHKNVVRAAPLGSWGKDGVIPSTPSTATKYETSFTYELPVKFDTVRGREVDPAKIRLVAFVSTYNSDTWKRQVLNSVKVNLAAVSATHESMTARDVKLYPNPTGNYTYLEFNTADYEDLQIELLDISGKRIHLLHNGQLNTGQYSMQINCNNLETGTYLIRMTSSLRSQVVKLSVVR